MNEFKYLDFGYTSFLMLTLPSDEHLNSLIPYISIKNFIMDKR